MFISICSQDGSSEQFIGEWAEARGIRDQLIIATKVSFFIPSSYIILNIFLLVHDQLQAG